jgi:hypothetical protein
LPEIRAVLDVLIDPVLAYVKGVAAYLPNVNMWVPFLLLRWLILRMRR